MMATARADNGDIQDTATALKAALPDPRQYIQVAETKHGGEVAGPCPKCGGTDRFFIRQDDSFMCRHCGAKGGDRIDFFQWIEGADFNELVQKYLSGDGHQKPKQEPARAIPANLKATYRYTDESGAELFQVWRYEEPGREKTFRQGTRTPSGEFRFGIKGIRRVLYRLTEVSKAGTIILTEGEKDADRLAEIGLTATTSPMGASNWKNEYAATLRGKNIAIFPDNDSAGQKYLDSVLSSLKGVARSVTVVRVPVGKDVTDWIQSGATKDDIQHAIDVAVEYRWGEANHAEVVADWPDPEPLTSTIDPQTYPVDALPGLIREAVEEVQLFVQAPLTLVASSALSAVSLACQGLADVERAAGLSGPSSLFLLSIAESGERKSQIDKHFFSGIAEYVEHQIELASPLQAEHAAKMAVWEAKRSAILDQIKKDTKAGKSTGEFEAKLEKHQKNEPNPPRVPRLIIKDDTPERLAQSLSEVWPSAGVISSEGGVSLGGSGMGQDSLIRNLSQLNVLWDGGTIDMGRKTSGSVRVSGARLSMGIQIQEATLRAFFDSTRGLARGTGFLARFLMAWPTSTMGTRMFREPPASWPALNRFNGRIIGLLESPLPWDTGGAFAIRPTMLTLSIDAKAAWVAYHDGIERELRTGGELADIRDVSAKSADNAARLAALFHLFNRDGGEISADDMTRGSRIAGWHLSESMRFFNEICLPEGMANAEKLDAWLHEHCRSKKIQEVSTRDIQRLGPYALRDTDRLAGAVRELENLGRARLATVGKKKVVRVNPKLITEASK